jgi:hypothetical protein
MIADDNSKAVGIGVKWLKHLLKTNKKDIHDDDDDDDLDDDDYNYNNDHKNKDHQLSNDGKMILQQLLKDNKLYDDENEKVSSDEDDSDDEDEDDHQGIKSRRMDENHNWSFTSTLHSNMSMQQHQKHQPQQHLLFPTLLKIINDFYQKHNNSAPTTQEIIKSCISHIEEEESKEQKGKKAPKGKKLPSSSSTKSSSLSLRRTLQPSNMPCTLTSNQVIFSALLFLSEDIYQNIPDLITSASLSISDPFSYFPKMPILIKNTSDETSFKKGIDKEQEIIPNGFHINHDNVPSLSNGEMLNDEDFLHKLSILESCFWSISSKVEYTPRIHVLPRIGMGLVSSKEEEDRLMKCGVVGGGTIKTQAGTKRKANTGKSKTVKRKTGGKKTLNENA